MLASIRKQIQQMELYTSHTITLHLQTRYLPPTPPNHFIFLVISARAWLITLPSHTWDTGTKSRLEWQEPISGFRSRPIDWISPSIIVFYFRWRLKYRRLVYLLLWHIWQIVADLTFANVQCSQDQWVESSIFLLELPDFNDVLLPLPVLLLLPPPTLFELVVRLQAPCESTSDKPFSRARTRFSK